MSSGSLNLELDGRALSFPTLEDFAFSLSGRTQIAANSVASLMQLAPNELRREAINIRDVERRFVDLLADALNDPGTVSELLRVLVDTRNSGNLSLTEISTHGTILPGPLLRNTDE